MGTEYCSKCGLLHDPDDGDCLGCDLVKQIKKLREIIDCIKEIGLRDFPLVRAYLDSCLKEDK